MEHRYSHRAFSSVKVLVYQRGLPVAIGWLRNLSRHGFFIATEYDQIVPNQLLEIEFLGPVQHRDSHRRYRALVVHQTAAGFGLTIDDGDPLDNIPAAGTLLGRPAEGGALAAEQRVAALAATR